MRIVTTATKKRKERKSEKVLDYNFVSGSTGFNGLVNLTGIHIERPVQTKVNESEKDGGPKQLVE